ncbi:MAG: MCE family protein [Deltaproteobacteria bacterium]|nr:MCE family protein [Deltaproteobacteria bacterium]PWB62493.1 MAG: paraquat-inducible protein B [Deltaproteobacteria bacterium]
MGKQASRTVIGAFVVGAVALGVAGILVFGSGKFLHERTRYVMFFDGSLKGLQVGSPVVMNGVKIGQVTDISVLSDPATLRFYSPVYIEIEQDKIRLVGERRTATAKFRAKYRYALYKPLMEKGMKAQLVLQSFVTGQLWINLGFYPDKPIRLVGMVKDVPEIPTVRTTLEEMQKTVENLPLKEIAAKLDNVMTGLDRIVNSPELHRTFTNMERASGSIDRLAKSVDTQVEPLAADVRLTLEVARGTLGEANLALASARGALAQAEKTLAFNEGVPGQVADNLLATLSAVQTSLEESRKALVEVQGLASQSVHLGYEAGATLENMKSLSRSLRSLSDYLERHPESLIRGKSTDEGDAR